MKKAGCETICFGLETASEELQKIINKNISLETMTSAIRIAKRVKLKIGINCLLGIPEEKKIDIERTLHYLRAIKPNFVFPSILVPFPGTDVFKSLVKRGRIKENVWDKYVVRMEPPVSLSENFSAFYYLFYIVQMTLQNRTGFSTPEFFGFSHQLKVFPSIMRFIYKNAKIFQFFRTLILNKIARIRFLKEYVKK
jgi:radical SAM superfamily enzyme YgiQ (UPF0313 family)